MADSVPERYQRSGDTVRPCDSLHYINIKIPKTGFKYSSTCTKISREKGCKFMKFVEIVLATPQRSSFPRKLAELEKQNAVEINGRVSYFLHERFSCFAPQRGLSLTPPTALA